MTQLEEFHKALQEKRQPVCVNCNKPLDTITQYLMEWLSWTWDEKSKRYIKGEGSGDAEKPIHEGCGQDNWDLIDGSSDAIKLGLTY